MRASIEGLGEVELPDGLSSNEYRGLVKKIIAKNKSGDYKSSFLDKAKDVTGTIGGMITSPATTGMAGIVGGAGAAYNYLMPESLGGGKGFNLDQSLDVGSEMVGGTQQKLAYKPTTEAGKAVEHYASMPFEWWSKQGEKAIGGEHGKEFAEKHPNWAALSRVGWEAVPWVAGGLIGKGVAKAYHTVKPLPVDPTVDPVTGVATPGATQTAVPREPVATPVEQGPLKTAAEIISERATELKTEKAPTKKAAKKAAKKETPPAPVVGPPTSGGIPKIDKSDVAKAKSQLVKKMTKMQPDDPGLAAAEVQLAQYNDILQDKATYAEQQAPPLASATETGESLLRPYVKRDKEAPIIGEVGQSHVDILPDAKESERGFAAITPEGTKYFSRKDAVRWLFQHGKTNPEINNIYQALPDDVKSLKEPFHSEHLWDAMGIERKVPITEVVEKPVASEIPAPVQKSAKTVEPPSGKNPQSVLAHAIEAKLAAMREDPEPYKNMTWDQFVEESRSLGQENDAFYEQYGEHAVGKAGVVKPSHPWFRKAKDEYYEIQSKLHKSEQEPATEGPKPYVSPETSKPVGPPPGYTPKLIKGKDFRYDGKWYLQMPDGAVYSMSYDRQSGLWSYDQNIHKHFAESGSGTIVVPTKEEAIARMAQMHMDGTLNDPMMYEAPNGRRVIKPVEMAAPAEAPVETPAQKPTVIRRKKGEKPAEPAPKGLGAQAGGQHASPGPPEIEQLTASLVGINNIVPPRSQLMGMGFGERMATVIHDIGYGAHAKLHESFKDLINIGTSMTDAYMRPPQGNTFKQLLGKYLYERTKYSMAQWKFAKEIKKTIPNITKREAIVNWIEAQGNSDLLLQRAQQTSNPKLKRGYEAALTLSPEEVTFARNITNYFDAKFDEAVKFKLLEHSVENYVNHAWQRHNKTTKELIATANAGILQDNPNFTKKRLFSTYFDGEQKGLSPKNKDIAYLVTAYDQAFSEALAARAFIKSLWGAKGTDGRPLVAVKGVGDHIPGDADLAAQIALTEELGLPSPKGPSVYLVNPNILPKNKLTKRQKETLPVEEQARLSNNSDYRDYDHPALRKWKWVDKDPVTNAPIMLEGSLKFHPEIMGKMNERFKGDAYYNVKNLLAPSAIRSNPMGRLALNTLGFFKSTLLSLSAFHQVQEGFHAVFHNVNPFGSFRPDESKFSNPNAEHWSPFRVDNIDLNDATQAHLVKNGLMVFDHSALEQFADGLQSTGLVNKMMGGGLKVAGEIIRGRGFDNFLDTYQHYLFLDYIPRLKMKMAREAYARNIERYGNKLTPDEIGELTSNQANAAFGELNYKWMGRSKTTQDVLRVLFLAPDFLEARLKFVGQAVKPHGQEQLFALLRGSAELYAFTKIANGMIATIDKGSAPSYDDYHFDKPFSIIYKGKEIVPRTVPGDIYHLAVNPRSFIYHRLNPLTMRTLAEGGTGRDEFGRKRNFALEMQDLVRNVTPIPLQGLWPESNRTILEGALQSIGVNTFKARDAATRKALDFANDNIPKGETSPETRAKMILRRNLRKDIAEYPEGIPQSVKDAYKTGKISMESALKLSDEKHQTELEIYFPRIHLDQAFVVWDKMSNEQKARMKTSMVEKIVNFISSDSHSPKEKDDMKPRIEKLRKELQGQ